MVRREKGERVSGCGIDGGQLTYCHSGKQRFEKGIVFSQNLKDVRILGDVDEDRKGIFCYRLYTLSHLLVFQRSREGVAHSVILD